MAAVNTHKIDCTNADGTTTSFKLYQEGGSLGAVKKLAITKEPKIKFAFSNGHGEGVLSYWVELNILNNYDGDLLNEFLTNDQADFTLKIEIDSVEVFQGTLDMQWNEKQLPRASSTMEEFVAVFHNGFANAGTKNIDDILTAINSSGNSLHTYSTSDHLGGIIFADLWHEFIFQNVCGYTTDDILIAHDWEASAFNNAGSDLQFRKMKINPYFLNESANRDVWYKAICRAFSLCVGYSYTLGKPVIQDIRKGSSGNYTAIPLTKVSTGYRTIGSSQSMNEQTGLKWLDTKPKAIQRPQYLAVTVNNKDGTAQSIASNDDANVQGAGILQVDVMFDPTVDCETGGGGQRYGISVLGVSSFVPATTFKGYDAGSPTTANSLFYANAFAQGSFSRALPNEENVIYKGELNDIIDPMLPVKIGSYRYRISKGELNTLRVTTKVIDSVLISDDDTNLTLA